MAGGGGGGNRAALLPIADELDRELAVEPDGSGTPGVLIAAG